MFHVEQRDSHNQWHRKARFVHTPQHRPLRPLPCRSKTALMPPRKVNLRAVQNLFPAVPIDQVCEEAALELTRLRAYQRPHRWTDSDML